jgi:uncharacterized surface protein with fasciclin (FAS1) repeats
MWVWKHDVELLRGKERQMRRMDSVRLGAVSGLLVLALMAAGCGEDDSAGNASGGQPAATPFGPACSDVPASGAGSFEQMMTAPVVDAAAANPLLSSLVMDLELAGMIDTLNSAAALTVFAPTDDAFAVAAQADPGAMEEMMTDPTGEFADLLAYHVVEEQIAPADLAGEHTTLQGGTLVVEGSGESFTVNGSASIVCGDIHADNATVYIIDEVLHP